MKLKATLIIFLVFGIMHPAFAGGLTPKTGNHFGEIPPLDYRIEYLDAKGITTVNETGIDYGGFGHENTILPEEYFHEYPLYFTGDTLRFAVHIKNVSKRTYKNLRVVTAQEFLNDEGGAGEPFPDSYLHDWFVRSLRPGEEDVLEGSMLIPNILSSGIDQTHLQILHWDSGGEDKKNVGSGRVIVDDPQAGIWCPKAL